MPSTGLTYYYRKMSKPEKSVWPCSILDKQHKKYIVGLAWLGLAIYRLFAWETLLQAISDSLQVILFSENWHQTDNKKAKIEINPTHLVQPPLCILFYLDDIPDEPTVPGLTRAAASNSLLEQVPMFNVNNDILY